MNLLITRKDGKQFTEEQLGELLREAGHAYKYIEGVMMNQRGGWEIIYQWLDEEYMRTHTCGFPLSPSEYSISFTDSIPVERVREMVDEIESHAVSQYTNLHEYAVVSTDTIRSIASKYLPAE